MIMNNRIEVNSTQAEIFQKIVQAWKRLDEAKVSYATYLKSFMWDDGDVIVFFNGEYLKDLSITEEILCDDEPNNIPEGWVDAYIEDMEYMETDRVELVDC